MESLYKVVGISRQGFHKYRSRMSARAERESQVIDRAEYHRDTHNRMGARPLYHLMRSLEPEALLEGIGRDKFEGILISNGLVINPVRVFHRTTYSGAFRFPNLVEGVEVRALNRIWVSDLTYYRLMDGWAYLTFILDLYSRRCLGYAWSKDLRTEHTTIPALKMALKARGLKDYKRQLIFHSDGGGQYIDKAFLGLLEKHNAISSMAEVVYENPHMERFHSTAKNDYLIPWGVNSISKLRDELPRYTKIYNHVRPHESLKYKTPVAFEEFIEQIPIEQRPMVLFKKIT